MSATISLNHVVGKQDWYDVERVSPCATSFRWARDAVWSQGREEGAFLRKSHLLLDLLYQGSPQTSPSIVLSNGDSFQLPVIYASVVPPRSECRFVQLLVSGHCLRYQT